MNKIYLITYNTNNALDRVKLHSHINSLFPKYLSDWWHHIDTAYLVATSLPVNDLYNLIFPGVPGRYLLIIEVNPDNAQGWLPKNAWEWIKKYRSH